MSSTAFFCSLLSFPFHLTDQVHGGCVGDFVSCCARLSLHLEMFCSSHSLLCCLPSWITVSLEKPALDTPQPSISTHAKVCLAVQVVATVAHACGELYHCPSNAFLDSLEQHAVQRSGDYSCADWSALLQAFSRLQAQPKHLFPALLQEVGTPF